MKKTLTGIFAALFIISASAKGDQKTCVIVIGDSTVATYKPESDKRGWGQLIGDFFDDKIKVKNYAVGGRSTKTFIKEGRWEKALAECGKGDFVLIQFGHNDSHAKTRPESTDANTNYKEYLRTYIDETREKGATPILITPMHRRVFHKNGEISQALKPYADAMKEVAKEKNVDCVDLYSLSEELMTRLGEEESAPLFCSAKDRSHFSEKGAKKMAELIVRGLENKQTSLKEHIVSAKGDSK
jgi:lysophospholipase L1-like esterase